MYILCKAGDQQSAVFACGCWMENNVVVSLGTGSFVDVNTGASPHSSLKGALFCILVFSFLFFFFSEMN